MTTLSRVSIPHQFHICSISSITSFRRDTKLSLPLPKAMSSSEHGVGQSQLPYWQMNVPPDQRTEQCPCFLLDISDKDRDILSRRDENYRRSSWE